MLTLSPAVPIYVATGATDLRRSIDGLSALVREPFTLDPVSPLTGRNTVSDSTPVVTLPDLLSPATALLHATYERAKGALASCARIDECHDRADKMASYAKQANDDELQEFCLRIQARAPALRGTPWLRRNRLGWRSGLAAPRPRSSTR